MIKKFKKWCKAERVNRPEKGTSQDMCPTNGDALFNALFWSSIYGIVILAIIFGNR